MLYMCSAVGISSGPEQLCRSGKGLLAPFVVPLFTVTAEKFSQYPWTSCVYAKNLVFYTL